MQRTLGWNLIAVALAAPWVAAEPAKSVNSGTTGKAVLTAPERDAQMRSRAVELISHSPVYFEPNLGQADPGVRFLGRGLGHQLFLSGSDALVVFPERSAVRGQGRREIVEQTSRAVRMTLDEARPGVQGQGLHPRESYSNYFLGNDPSRWRSRVPNYEKVTFSGVYEGIDVVYYANQRQLEFDFVIHAGADPDAIRLSYQGIDKTRVESNGDLILTSGNFELRQQKPRIYQESNGRRREIGGSYRLLADGRIGFHLEGYDRTQAVVIDPILQFATFLGGSGQDFAGAIVTDTLGNAYVVGQTASTNFPTRFAFQNSNRSTPGQYDGFITKINITNATASIVYSTYVGGSSYENCFSIALDPATLEAYVTGQTSSTNFPTAGANATTAFQGGMYDGFLLKLSADGTSLLYSTYIGTSLDDLANSVALFQGQVWVGGSLGSGYQQVSGVSPLSPALGPYAGFIARFNKSTPHVQAYTYVGGTTDGSNVDTVESIAIDSFGNIYGAGALHNSGLQLNSSTTFGGVTDGFVAKWSNTQALQYLHYIGGSLNDHAQAIAVTPAGEAYVTGYILSTNTRANMTLGSLANNAFDTFALRVDASGAITNFAAIGGSQQDIGYGIAVDSAGTVYIAGQTTSPDFPTTFGAPQRTIGGGSDVNIFRLRPNQKQSSTNSNFGFDLLFSTFFGYVQNEYAFGVNIDSSGNILFCGVLGAPTSNPGSVFPDGISAFAYGGDIYDAFLAKLAAAQLNVTSKGYWVLDTSGFYTYVADVSMRNLLGGATINNLATGYRAVPSGTSFTCTGCSSGLALVLGNVTGGSSTSKVQFRLRYTSQPVQSIAEKILGSKSGERAAFTLPPGTPPQIPEIGTTTDSPAAPPPVPGPGRPASCTPSFSTPNLPASKDGGTFSVPIANLNTGCGWFYKDSSGAVTVNTSTDYQPSDATLDFVVPANTSATPRTASITVRAFDEVVLTISQDGTCSYAVTPLSVNNFAAAGGPVTFTVTTTAGCTWSATNIPSFLTATSATSGTGSGSVSFNIQPNGTSSRSGGVTIANITVPISQLGTGGAPTGLRFVSLPPCRVMETRSAYNFEGRTGSFGPPTLNANETRTLNLPVSNVCSIPSTAKAYVVNVTVIPITSVGFVTVWPAGDPRPNVWTIRSPDGQTIANSAIVKAGINGGISVFTSDNTDLIIDISGYYTDSTAVSGLAYYPLTPCRVIETRIAYRTPPGPFGPPSMSARETRKFRIPATPYCTVPAAAAYSVTITAVPPGPLAYLTAWPDGSGQPNVSSINSFVGRVLANSVIIPASSDGSIDVFVFDNTDFIVDINGYYAPDDGQQGLFYFPVTQCRASDSTVSGGAYADDTARTINIPNAPGCSGIPSNAQGYAINVTALPNGSPMPFLTAYPTGQSRPNASILNAFQGQIVTNAAIIPAGTNGSIDIYAFRRTNVVVEISGYFGR